MSFRHIAEAFPLVKEDNPEDLGTYLMVTAEVGVPVLKLLANSSTG